MRPQIGFLKETRFVSSLPHMRHAFLRFNANSLLSGGLLALLLLAYVALVYVAVVAVGALPSGSLRDPSFSPPWWLNLLAFALIAVTFLPTTRWLRDHVNDLVYAQHDNPYVLVSQVNQQLQAMTNPQLTLPVLAEVIARELQLPYVAIETTHAELPWRYTFGSPTRASISQLSITYLDKPLGTLHVSARGVTQPLSESDLLLLRDVTQQLGIALHAAQLTAELQGARERLVIAREEERRRIRNDLHDGLAPTLSSLQLQLGAIRNLIRSNPDQAEGLTNELCEDLRNATAEIRQLVYDLRPPRLDELGLVGALKSFRLQGSELNFEVHAPAPMPKLSAAVEVAVYRIASEAMHNVVKHAQATECVVELEMADDHLTLSVTDNGQSLPPEHNTGVGFYSMKERAAELGGTLTIQSKTNGGTQVVAQLPL
jgi:signal transduction histidine kinase